VSISVEELGSVVAQLFTLTEANAKAIATLEQRQQTSQSQIETLRVCVTELRESQALTLQQFCSEQKAAASEFRRSIDATLSRLERALDCMLVDAENQGKLINEIKDLSVRLLYGQYGGN
jgi:DNA repair exonuclease SbcCD ATPase subunit